MITILTTVYNGSEFLEECAKGVLLQSCDWEWWIGINGHGTGGDALDRAKAIATDPRIHVVNLPDAVGRVTALNTLRALACTPTTEWIAILDCDDIWEPEKLVVQMAAIRMSQRPIDILGTFCNYFGEGEGAPTLPCGWIRPEDILRSNPIINSSVLFRAEMGNGLDVWEDRFGLEDYDLWLRCAAQGKTFFNVPHALVRHRLHAASAFNGKGAQDLEGLRAFHLCGLPTVVTAYYPIRSKHSIEIYLKWMTEFWPRMPCNLVFYTEPGLAQQFQTLLGSKARVIGLPFSELAAFQKLSPLVWVETQKKDLEAAHTPELYALWYEKKEFILRTIATNPFHSREFVWCDAGICRNPEWIPLLTGFPRSELIPKGTMLLLEIDPLEPEDFVIGANGLSREFGTRATFGGGILASDASGWNRWSKAYDAMLLKYLLNDRFIGKDQNLIAAVVIQQPHSARIIKRPQALGPIHGWFYLLFFLSGLEVS